MTWHSYQNRGDIAEIPNVSLIVSFANLLQKMEREADTIEVYAKLQSEGEFDLDWASLTAYDPQIMPERVGQSDAWPQSPLSILRFYTVNSDGVASDYYCAVANLSNHTIIDSLTGQVQYTGQYGEPVAWASYATVAIDEDDDEETGEDIPVTITPKIRTGTPHKVVEGEDIWRLSARFHIAVDDIMSHNELPDYSTVQPGLLLYLPVEKVNHARQIISYELLPSPRPMHVSRKEGARKWSFGNVRSWKDVAPTGQTYPENHNLEIVAIAHVPIEEDIAAYYMDSNALGDYKNTGLVKYMIGFNWQHLSDGHVFPQFTDVPELDADTVQQIEKQLEEQKKAQEIPAPAPVVVPEPTPEPTPEPVKTYWKDSYRAYDGGIAREYSSGVTIMVEDREGNIPGSFPIRADRLFTISGIFKEDGVTWGRIESIEDTVKGVLKPVKPEVCFAVNMEDKNIYAEEELFSTEATLAEKVALRRTLSADETITVFFSKNIARINSIKTALSRKK